MSYWTVPPEWLGETCFILAGGPSLRCLNLNRIEGLGRIIAINDSFLKANRADVLYFCDEKWWQRNQSAVRGLFSGHYIVTLKDSDSRREVPGVKMLRCTGPTGLETDPNAIRHGSNSGYQAINLAYHFGAKRIILLGYDMCVANDGRTHWFGDHPGQTAAGFTQTLQVMLQKFPTLVEPLKKEGVEVINANPASALNCWPKMTLDVALSLVCSAVG